MKLFFFVFAIAAMTVAGCQSTNDNVSTASSRAGANLTIKGSPPDTRADPPFFSGLLYNRPP